jgi:hypothetical protein
MPVDEVREELEAMSIRVQPVMKLRSRRTDQNAEKDRTLTPHFILSVARGPDLPKMRSLTELCGL